MTRFHRTKHQTGNNEITHTIYWMMEQKCRKYTKIIVCLLPPITLIHLVTLLNSIYSICIGNFDTTTWLLFFDMVVPFSIETICGYYAMWLFQTNVDLVYSLIMISITSHFISGCLYIHAICDQFKYLMHQIEENVKRNLSETNPSEFNYNYRRINGLWHKAIELHVKMIK